MAAVGRHWHTQVMDRGRTWFTTANAAIATSKPLRGSDGFPTNNTEQCARRGMPCAHQACPQYRPQTSAASLLLPGQRLLLAQKRHAVVAGHQSVQLLQGWHRDKTSC